MQRVEHMIDILRAEDNKKELSLEPDDFVEEIIPEKTADVEFLRVDYVPVDAIVLPEIKDTYGRLSDAVEALESATGLSVIPLHMANIAPEVISLKRHTIFTFDGVRYAMSSRMREGTVARVKEEIFTALLSGLPYRTDLVTNVTYEGKDYKTLSLSQTEWTYVLSLFRNYKQSLTVQNGNKLILEIFAERTS